jgi:hypothetical protein
MPPPRPSGDRRSEPILTTSTASSLSKGGASASVHDLVVFLNRNGSLDLTTLRYQRRERVCSPVYRQHHRRCVEQAVYKFVRIADAQTLSKNGATASGTLRLTACLARIIDTLAGSTAVRAGQPLGTITVSAIRA